jgi:hypothetical protein
MAQVCPVLDTLLSVMTAPREYRRVHFVVLAFVAVLVAAFILSTEVDGGAAPAAAAETGPCTAPVTNPIVCENSKEGVSPSEWQIEGIGDESIQGFATQISVNPGETESFKINTPSTKYHVNILRLGYYEGDGARMIEANIKPSVSLPQKQPECRHETVAANGSTPTGLIECGNWAVSASWKVPTAAVSGLYMAELVREDVSGGKPIDHTSQVFFIVKDETSHAPIAIKTSDATWEAYNAWGGNSLYTCTKWCPEGEPEGYKAAFAVSYNRPFDGTIATDSGQSDPFYAEYELSRWMEKEGYNVTYLAQPDLQAHPQLLLNHRVVISSGHDEYWSAGERKALEEAREHGVNLAFFSGNEGFWKTRWAPSVEGSVPNRTLTTYKETHFAGPVDPEEPNVSTSSWRDPRFGTAGGAGKPENSLTGQYFLVNSGSADIKVPGTFAKLRFWRNTAVSKLGANETLTLSPGTNTLGYEWDVDANNGFRPSGRISMSSTTVNNLQTFTDYGSVVAEPTVATHSLSLYRAASGALVFGAGTVDWSWGLENENAWGMWQTDPSENPPDPTMEQATINLFADMGAQPSTVTNGLVAATESTDHTPPTATVTSPTAGQSLHNGEAVTVSGTATDTGGGVVAGVEVSTDGGKTWNPAIGTSSWTYSWFVSGYEAVKVEARAIDDSANIGAASTPVTVNVGCPCSMLGSRTPSVADAGDTGSINVGVKFRSEVGGTVNGIRFFKATANTGTHLGDLWTAGGELLAQATFSGETTSGWQQVQFSSPVTITAGTTYVASYYAPKGHYSDTAWQLNNPPALGERMLEHPPLQILASTESANGVFEYGSKPEFPTQGYHADNYWVDVLFTPAVKPGKPGNVKATAAPGGATVTWTAPTEGGAPTTYKVTPYVGTTAKTPVSVSGSQTSATVSGLAAGTSYTFVVTGINTTGEGPASSASNSVVPTALSVPGAPTAVAATVSGTTATIKWSEPANNGGVALTSYTITTKAGGIAQGTRVVSGSPPATQTTVSGLNVGTSYTFTVKATNSVGTGAESTPSNAVTPSAPMAPGAPSAVTATGKSSGAVLGWTAPASDGGSPITGYRVTSYLGTVAQASTTFSSIATTATVNGLTNGASYTFKVAAINAVGTGAESAASAAVTPFDTIFEAATPATVDSADGGAVNVGVKFKTDVGGTVNGIRFFKAAANTGTHLGDLWTAGGELLAQVTFTGESASGWQQATFSSPVKIQPNTTYVASYLAPNGHYSVNGPNLASAVDNAPLHTIANATSPNGVYLYGGGAAFPKESWEGSNYWVDVLFVPEAAPVAPTAPTGVKATAGLGSATVEWTAPSGGGTPTSYVVTPYVGGAAQSAKSFTAAATQATLTGLTAGTSYTFTVKAVGSAGAGPESATSNAVTPTAPGVPGAPTGLTATAKSSGATLNWTAPAETGGSPITGYRITPYLGGTAQSSLTTSSTATSAALSGLTNGTAYTFKVAAVNGVGAGAESAASAAVTPFDTIFEAATPTTADSGDTSTVNLGVKFTSDVAGTVNGIRFYKGAANTGTHVGSLWTAGGERLAQVTFTGESASGWQQATFATPVKIQPNTTYVASYLAPNGHYSQNGPSLVAGVDNPPLHAVSNLTSINGVFAYGSSSAFPEASWEASNYWVDVLFAPAPAPVVPGTPTAVKATAGLGSATVEWTAPSGGSEPTSYLVTGYVGGVAKVTKTLSGAPPATATTLTGLTSGSSYTFTVKASNQAGAGTESQPSNAVTPSAASVPGAPAGVGAVAGNGDATVTWAAPAGDGGSTITGYKVIPVEGSQELVATNAGAGTTSVTVSGLANGTNYSFKVAAVNGAGQGPASAASAAVMPRVTLFEEGMPATLDVAESASVVLGVKFSTAVGGVVRGVRFYKAAANTGPHEVGLWTSGGELLARATSSGETTSGWQEVSFATPVPISPESLYVVAYLAPNGNYSATSNAFATSAVTNLPLSSPATTTSPNGLYEYTGSLAFPTNTYKATNYWVDVVFTP